MGRHRKEDAMNATMTQQALPSLSVPSAAPESGAVSGASLTLLRLRAQRLWQGRRSPTPR